MKNPWIKKWHPTKYAPVRTFPDLHTVLSVATTFGAEANEDGQFSSPELTDWYVKKYVLANNIKNDYPKGFPDAVV